MAGTPVEVLSYAGPQVDRPRSASLAAALALTIAFAGLAFVAAALGLSPRAVAAADAGVRLIMIEEKGCRYCIKWDADVGSGYAKSGEGRFAPLKRVKRGAAEIKSFNPVVYTPTFIVVRSGEEIGRITGYPGRVYFWSELKELLASVGYFPGL
ncbi:MAG: thioredoxin [Hyphomicrobium sp.]|jgi:hypothetical protein